MARAAHNSAPSPANEHVEAVLAGAAVRAEKVISIVRICFVTLVYGRATILWSHDDWAEAHLLWLSMPNIVLTLGVSLFMLARLRPSRHLPRYLLASVLIDAVGCFQALGMNVLYPGRHYLGLLRMPDIGALVLVTLAAGFRLSPAVALTGTLANLVSFAVLIGADAYYWGSASWGEPMFATMHGLYIATAGVLSAVLAARTRNLARAGAAAAVRAAHAKKNLAVLLREHHDVRTLLSTASLRSDMLAESQPAADLATRTALDDLRKSLREVHGLIDDIKERAYSEIVALEEPTAIEVGTVVDEVVELTRRQFPGSSIGVSGRAGAALVAGGAGTLRRVLHNLLVNACEGDGQHAAANITVVLDASPESHLTIHIVDDGPGFLPHVLAGPPGAAGSSKAYGSGFGLALADGLVRASGGALRRQNRPGGGAEVVVELVRAS